MNPYQKFLAWEKTQSKRQILKPSIVINEEDTFVEDLELKPFFQEGKEKEVLIVSKKDRK